MEREALAIDPGEKHCGVALFRMTGWCQWALEVDPSRLEAMVERTVADLLIVEEFRLYPWRMLEQGFSQIETAKVIGVVEYIAKRRGIAVAMQPALIKKPTVAHARSRNYRWKAHGNGPHAKDAEIHGLYYFREVLGWT